MGKFEGDPFERLWIKVSAGPADAAGEHLHLDLLVRIETGEEVVFDLLAKAFVCEHPNDPTMFTLDHCGTIVVFKVSDSCMQTTAPMGNALPS